MTLDKILCMIALPLTCLGLVNTFLGLRALQKARDAATCEDYDAFHTYMKKSSTHETICFTKMIVVLGLLVVSAIIKLGG